MGWTTLAVLGAALTAVADTTRVPCDLSVPVPGPHHCLVVPVEEAPGGRVIDLFVVVAEATGPETHPDPVYWLAGGPGQAASGAAPYFVPAFANLREDRDLVFVDFRGTGKSNPLVCPPLGDPEEPNTWMREFLAPERYRACLPELQEKADLTRYNTALIADDVDAVREAMGHEQINLIGGSYGTRVGFEYIRRHGEHTRTATLEGVSLRFQDHLLTQAELLERGIADMKEQCRMDAACHGAFPDFATDLDAVLARLAERPLETRVMSPQTGREHDLTLTLESFLYALRFSLYYAGPAATLPLNITAAADGDWTPFVDMAMALALGFSTSASGMTMAVRCAEVVPYTDEADARRRAEGTVFGTLRLEQEMEICDSWPRGTIPDDMLDPVVSDVPVLMLTGEFDITSPPEEAANAERHLRKGKFVRLGEARHDGVAGPCTPGVRKAFIDAGDWRGIDFTCLEEAKHPPFVTGG